LKKAKLSSKATSATAAATHGETILFGCLLLRLESLHQIRNTRHIDSIGDVLTPGT
jgi:hypothetical protein